MTVTINGTNGVTTPEVVLDNSAADGAQVVLKSSGYSDWNLDNYSGRLRAYYGATEYWTVNASGNLGLGVTPSAWGTSASTKALQVGNVSLFSQFSGGNYLQLANNAYQDSSLTWKYISSDYASNYQQFNGIHKWFTAPSGTAGNAISFTQAMTLDSSGNLLVGTTSVSSTAGRAIILSTGAANETFVAINHDASASSGGYFMGFRYNGTFIGNIAQNGTTATSYNTSSDYRLKNTIAPMTGALEKLALLKPCTYKWNADGSDGEGFIAHELAEVCPGAVTGEKDAVDADGNPKYQGIDTSFLVATLTAAIQELKAINDAQAETITALTARVTALENQP